MSSLPRERLALGLRTLTDARRRSGYLEDRLHECRLLLHLLHSELSARCCRCLTVQLTVARAAPIPQWTAPASPLASPRLA